MINKKIFVQRLNAYLKSTGMTWITLAEKFYISPPGVRKWTHGIALPSTPLFYQLLETFNCSGDYILGLTDVQTQQNFLPIPPFPEQFPKFVERMGSTFEQLETDISLSHSTVQAWLNKKSLPTLENLVRMAAYFHCSVDYFIGHVE